MTELLKISAYAIPLIVAVIILRALLINRLPKRTFFFLWVVVLCRLLIPVTLPSPFSVYSLASRPLIPETTAPATTPIEESVRDVSLHQTHQAEIYLAQASPQIASAPAPVTEALSKTYSPDTVLSVLWTVGFIGCAGFFVVTHLRCRRAYHAALPVDDAAVGAWLCSRHFRRTVCVRQSDEIHAPLTYGLWRPVILLPKSLGYGDKGRLSFVLTHEATHIRRFDVVWKWLLALAMCVHWFNPLVWAMYALACRDIELCCDEAVVRSFGETVKSAYALALIGLEETRSRFTPLCNNFSKTAIEERIISIMKYQKASLTAMLLALVLIMGTTAAFAFGGADQKPQSAPTANQSTAYVAATENRALNYEKYAPFGIVYDAANDTLSYHGQVIRCFDDEYPIADGAIVGINHYSEDGIIDVHTVRDLSQPVHNADGSYDPSGVLMGIAPYSQAEFEARTLDMRENESTGPAYTAIADGSTSISPEERAREYSIYEPFGITYDKENDLLFYQGRLIYYFLDVLSSNGEDFASGKFQGAMRSITQESGDLSIQVTRDYDHPDVDGFGKIIGVETSIEDPSAFYLETVDLRQSISPYAPYGLALDESTNTMWYMGKQVRGLYDPVTGNFLTSSLGIQYPADAVDVEPVYMNNVLAGLRQVTQEEYDRHTEERRTRQQDTQQIGSGIVGEPLSGVEWWTAEEYESWLNHERIDLQSIIGAKAWNSGDGWFIWTQEKVDETIHMYEQILEELKRGGNVSKPIGDSGAVLMQDIGQMNSIAQDDATIFSVASSAVLTVSENVAEEVAIASAGFSAVIILGNGTEVDLGTFGTYVERYKAVEAYCEQQMAEGAMAKAEADAIIRQYM